MKPETIYKRRLMRLARHLLHNKLGHAVFDFSHFNVTMTPDGIDHHPKGCGTNGCAIGECPIVFPKLWYWNQGCIPCARDQYTSRERFFGLCWNEFDTLFYPDTGLPKSLPRDASRYDVAKNIISFVKTKYGKVRLTKADTAQLALATLC